MPRLWTRRERPSIFRDRVDLTDWRALCIYVDVIELGTAPKNALTSVELLDEGDDWDNFSVESRDGLGVWTPGHTSSGAIDAQVCRTKVAAPHERSSPLRAVPAMCRESPKRLRQSALTILQTKSDRPATLRPAAIRT